MVLPYQLLPKEFSKAGRKMNGGNTQHIAHGRDTFSTAS